VRCPDAPPELTGLVDSLLAPDHWDRPSSSEARAELGQLADDLAPPPPRPSVVRIRKPKWTPNPPLDGPPPPSAGPADETEKSS